MGVHRGILVAVGSNLHVMKTLEQLLSRIGLPDWLQSMILAFIYGLMFLTALWALGYEQGRFKYLDW